jgi:sirohydrochlorin ferrochelatase
MKKIIILIGHGNIPDDFPREKLREYFKLRNLYKTGFLKGKDEEKFMEMEESLKRWERNENNDKHYFDLKKMGEEIEREIKIKTDFAFNEFCYPDIFEKFEKIKDEYDEIYFVSTLIFEGKHSDEIKNKIEELKDKYKDKKIFYIPLKQEFLKEFFIKNIKDFI